MMQPLFFASQGASASDCPLSRSPIRWSDHVVMKIKCPGCSTVLNVPETAAGKIVKCRCGKQLRAPGGGGAAPAQAAPTQRAAAQPVQQLRPQAKPAAQPAKPVAQANVGGSHFDNDLFDELTEDDLQPVKAVKRPGTAQSSGPKGVSASSPHAVAGDASSRRSFLYVAGNIGLGVGAMAIGGGIIYWYMTSESSEEDSSGVRFRRRKSPFGIAAALIISGLAWMGKAFGFHGSDDDESDE